VTPNLYSALQNVRSSARGASLRHLWLDALCINQADTLEKEQHVRLMGEIYPKAGDVIAWLGDNAHGTHTVKLDYSIPRTGDRSISDVEELTKRVQDLLHVLASIPVVGRCCW
jgi:hypothetical protein